MSKKDSWPLLISNILEKYNALSGDLGEGEKIETVAAAMRDSYFSVEYLAPDLAREFFFTVIRFLNERKGGTPFSEKFGTSDSKLIVQLMKDGETAEDVCRVIDKMANEWLGGKMQIYLRPKTLFKKSNYFNYKAQLPGNGIEQQKSGKSQFDKFVDSATAAQKRAFDGD
jgi:uncharacterized phage protein (TIGR02220 family)